MSVLRLQRLTALTIAMSVVSAGALLAQGPPDGGPGGPPPGMGGPRPGMPGMGGPPPMSPTHVPMEALAAGLKLDSNQKTKIQGIQAALRKQRESLIPRPGSGGPNGGPPDMSKMRAGFEKLRAAEQQSNKSIESVLTDKQKKSLPGLLKQLNAWRDTGIPLELYGPLKVTAVQQKSIEAAANKSRPAPAGNTGQRAPNREAMESSRRKGHELALAGLTASQKKMIDSFIATHPRPQFGGGPGGPGGPPPQFRGGQRGAQ